MKKYVALIIFCLMIISFTTAQAEIKAGSFSLTPFAGGYFFEGNQDYKNNVTLGLRAGYNFTENFGSELFCNWVPSEFKDDDSKNRVYIAGIEGLYHIMPRSRFVPFLAIGIGAIHYSSGDSGLVPSKFAADYGAGFKFFLTDNIALRADIRHVLPLGDSLEYGDNPHDVHNDFMASVGINLAFGGGKATEEAKVEETPAPAVVVADADHDGVPDDQDMCPDTQAGLAVNEKGCSPDYDSDRDGVSDDRDKCPGNPASIVVNKDGCPPDTDNDGVPDYKDNCQGTPANAKVDAHGCAPDSDADGVPDSLDKCPGTPSGTVVDENGCVAAVEKKTISMRLKIEFDTDKAVVKKKYHSDIKTVGDFMKEHPDATATIVGHTDNVGNAKKNLALSKARANSVRQYLIKKFGIKGYRITAIGYGAERPVASNATKEGRQKNRRIVAVFETK